MRTIAERYALEGILGRGAMGDVWLARDERLGREVAVKFLRADLAADAELRRRFEHEAHAEAQLNHPNVLKIYDSGEDADEPFIVMERLSGRTLADEITRGPIEVDRVVRWAKEALGALGAAHRAGIVHRDIKPGNLLLADDDSIKVADFGIAKVLESSDATSLGAVWGTAAYVAPERFAGEPATPASDQYALGVVLYEALTGVCPYRGDHPVAVMHAVQRGEASRIRELRAMVPAAVAAVVERAMARAPEDRYTSVGAMEADLDTASALSSEATVPLFADVRDTRPIDATSVMTVDRGPASTQGRARRPFIWLIAAAFTVLIGMAVLVGHWTASGARTNTTRPTTAPETTVTAPATTVPQTVAPTAPPVRSGKPGKGGRGGGQGDG